MRRPLFLPILALLACGLPHDGWVVRNATPEQARQAQRIVTAAEHVTGDPHGWLGHGGSISLVTVPYGLDGTCQVPAPYHVSGCTYGQEIVVLVMPPLLGPDLRTTALAHELAHVAIGRDEAQADALAVLINREAGP